jgi:hypothetical protein
MPLRSRAGTDAVTATNGTLGVFLAKYGLGWFSLSPDEENQVSNNMSKQLDKGKREAF